MKTGKRLLLSTLITTLLGACSSAPAGVYDPELEAARAEDKRQLAEAEARRNMFERVLTETDRVMAAYAKALLESGAPQSDRQANTLHKHLTRAVDEHFANFLRTADDRTIPRNRAIALAALGLSGSKEALDPLLNGLGDDNPEIVGNAAFGLGLLADPRTPPSYLTRVISNESFSDGLRGGAAWSLYKIQESAADKAPFAAAWQSLLDKPLETTNANVAVSALRGLGRLRQKTDADLIKRYVSHPVPKVRQAAAVALGRLGVRATHEALLALIGPAEDNPNVRLTARKALQELSGGIDRGYDVEEWRQLFEDS